jgi:hypothetical protein
MLRSDMLQEPRNVESLLRRTHRACNGCLIINVDVESSSQFGLPRKMKGLADSQTQEKFCASVQE